MELKVPDKNVATYKVNTTVSCIRMCVHTFQGLIKPVSCLSFSLRVISNFYAARVHVALGILCGVLSQSYSGGRCAAADTGGLCAVVNPREAFRDMCWDPALSTPSIYFQLDLACVGPLR